MKIVIDTSQWKILNHLKRHFKVWWKFWVWIVIVNICFTSLGFRPLSKWQYWVILMSGGGFGIWKTNGFNT